MNYAQIREFDIANGVGIRTTIFVTGCTHNCPGCFNKAYMNFNYGKLWTNETTQEVIKYLSNENVSGLTILGGEPFQNEVDLYDIVLEIKKFIDKNIWIYSGYTYEEIVMDENKKKLMELCDVLVDGKFILSKKNLRLKFRGSSNQRIIDIKRTLKEGKIILYLD